MARKWKVVATIPFPLDQVAPDESHGGFPQNLQWESRIVETTELISGFEVRLRKAKRAKDWKALYRGHVTEPAEIQIIAFADDETGVIEVVDAVLEDICDNLAFRLQMPLPIYRLTAVDITEPVGVGARRRFIEFASEKGFSHAKFRASASVGARTTEKKPRLRTEYAGLTARTRAVLRWFHKALMAEFDSDKFIFLMVCVEVLSKEYAEKVKAPYVTACKHEILNCPTCGKAIDKFVNGATVKKYLSGVLGMEELQAKLAWDLRQMVHGDVEFDESRAKRIPEISGALEAAISIGIKYALEMSFSEPPFVSPNTTQFCHLAVSGIKRISKRDLS